MALFCNLPPAEIKAGHEVARELLAEEPGQLCQCGRLSRMFILLRPCLFVESLSSKPQQGRGGRAKEGNLEPKWQTGYSMYNYMRLLFKEQRHKHCLLEIS